MLKPKVDVKEFEKYGFKHCKGRTAKELGCYYLCVSRGKQMIFVSPVIYTINDWEDDDSRIHSNPNCRYSDRRTALDITYELIKADMLDCVFG